MAEQSGSVLDGAATLARCRAIELHDGQIALWWLGQSGFLIRSAQSAILIDPFLSANPDRVVAPPVAPETLTGLQLIACTHDHIDHLDKPSIPALSVASPHAVFMVPTPVVSEVTALGVAPRTAVEEAVASIWQELLGVTAVGIHDNFFDCWGDSLVAVKLIAALNRIGMRIGLSQLFKHQTVAELAEALSGTAAE